MTNDICVDCSLNKNGRCTKFERTFACKPSARDWLESIDALDGSYISVDKMCRYGSIFGNSHIGLTLDDIERIKNGEIVHIPGEYGIFIGLKEEASRDETVQNF